MLFRPTSMIRRLKPMLLFRLLLSIAFIVSSAFVQATPQQLLGDLHSMRLASTNAVTNYYMFSGLDADSKYEQRIVESMERFDSALNSAQMLADNNGMTDSVKEISVNWKKFKNLMNINRTDIISKGFPEVGRVLDMSETNETIVNQLSAAYVDLQQKSGIVPNKKIQQARTLALLMEEITSEYAIRATTNMGHVFAGIGDSAIVEMADNFQKQLQALLAAANSPKTEALLSNIESKWKFIETRIRNFNENTVVFLVVSYNDRIVEHLQELEELL